VVSAWRCGLPGFNCFSDGAQATPCCPGYFSLEAETCSGCGQGKYALSPVLPCFNCSAGTYSRLPAAECARCPAGTAAKGITEPCLSNRTRQAFALVTQASDTYSRGTRIAMLNLSDHTTQTLTYLPPPASPSMPAHVCVDPAGEGAWLASVYELFWLSLTPPYNLTRVAGQFSSAENVHVDGPFETARCEAIMGMVSAVRF